MSYPQDSLDATPEMALEEALKDVRGWRAKGEAEPEKALIVFLWDEDGRYDTQGINAGMRASEVVALLEVLKARWIEKMNQPAEEED